MTLRDERTPSYRSNSWIKMKIGSSSKVDSGKSLIEWKINNGSISIVSKAGLNVPNLYFIKIGLTVLSAKKAPFLNFMIPVPFVVPPSTKIKNG